MRRGEKEGAGKVANDGEESGNEEEKSNIVVKMLGCKQRCEWQRSRSSRLIEGNQAEAKGEWRSNGM